MIVEITDFIKLTAEQGYELSNGVDICNTVSLPLNSDYSNWKQVLITTLPNDIASEFELYKKRMTDGGNEYLKLSAEFRILKNNGVISETIHNAIELILTPVRNEIMFGQWKKGLEILEEIGSAQIGVSLYDRLHLIISNYITENY